MSLSTGSRDPFTVHLEQDLDESVEKSLGNLRTWQQKTRKVSNNNILSLNDTLMYNQFL